MSRSRLIMARGGLVSKLLGVVGFRRRFRRPRAHQRGRRMLVAGIVPAAVAAAALFPAGAGAQNPGAPQTLTQGFDVHNLSSIPIRLEGVSGGDFQGRPPDGSVLNPGAGVHHYEMIFKFANPQEADPIYRILVEGVGVYFYPKMYIDGTNNVSASCSVTAYGVCAPSDLSGGWRDVYFFDDPGTVYNLPASLAQAQAQALKSFCDGGNAATCKFTATSEAQVDSPTHPVGHALINNTDEEQDTKVTVEDTVGSSDSVEVGVKVGGEIAELLDVEVSAKYGHEWTQEHTFKQDVTVHCPAQHKCWIEAVEPMYRDTGNFTVTLGNTTWNLTGVYFDSPDSTRVGSYSVEQCPSDKYPAPCDQWPKSSGARASTAPIRASSAQRKRKVLSGTYTVPHKVAVRGIVEPKLRHAIRGPSSVTAGGKASYRIALSRRQPHDRLSYAVKNVRVRSTAAGRPARHWTFSALRAFQSRKMNMNIAVLGTAGGRHCVSVRAVAKHARAAKARHCAPIVRGSRVVGRG
jgi:hypothetical protein